MCVISSILNSLCAYMGLPGSKNIILDMDSTLIDGNLSRPHLKEFLHFCFKSFDHVSIWTAASPKWFSHAYHHVIRPNMPKNKQFHFIWCLPECCRIVCNGMMHVVKPLANVYSRYADTHNTHNTIIVDDSPSVCVLNKPNSIIVSKFKSNVHVKDDVLQHLIQYLKHVVRLRDVRKMHALCTSSYSPNRA